MSIQSRYFCVLDEEKWCVLDEEKFCVLDEEKMVILAYVVYPEIYLITVAERIAASA